MDAPVVTRLSVTPIKGLRLHHPEAVVLGLGGAVGDRDFLLVDPGDTCASITRLGALVRATASYDPAADALSVAVDDGASCSATVELGDPVTVKGIAGRRYAGRLVIGPFSDLFAELTGRPLRLVKADAPSAGVDHAPVTLLGEGSVRALERASGLGPIDPRRFRMLIQLSTEGEHVEDTWEGRTVAIGGARLRVDGPVPRCAATTRDPDRGQRDQPIVQAIRDYRGMVPTVFGDGVPFGVYATVLEGGTVRVGDRLMLADAR